MNFDPIREAQNIAYQFNEEFPEGVFMFTMSISENLFKFTVGYEIGGHLVEEGGEHKTYLPEFEDWFYTRVPEACEYVLERYKWLTNSSEVVH